MFDWSKSHNGLMLCSYDQTTDLMPEVIPIIDNVKPHLQLPMEDYVIDVKIHMLMPGEYPCIPNWHTDFVPRDSNLKREANKIQEDLKMYLWVSGEPKTEWQGNRHKFLNDGWVEFDQKTIHRGVKSNIHTWRCFIRIIPKCFIHKHTLNVGTIRRHTQVYIDQPEKFRW